MTRKLGFVFTAAATLAFAATGPASAYEQSVKRYKIVNAWPKMSKPKEIVVVGTPKKERHFSGVKSRVSQGKSQRSRPRAKGHVKAFSGQTNQ